MSEKPGEPTPPQEQGWPAIRAGGHTLIAAPTGTGKTLVAFLTAIDLLVKQGQSLPDETQVLYISPLKALGNDIQKNLQGPLEEIAEKDPFLPHIRAIRNRGEISKITVSAADPLNFRGILTPEERVSPLTRRRVEVG